MITLFLIYLIGCVLSFLRIYASFKDLNETYKMGFEIADIVSVVIITILSWFGFITGIAIYIEGNEDKFF